MFEVWVRGNRRLAWWALGPPLAVGALAAALAAGLIPALDGPLGRIVGGVMALAAALVVGAIAFQLRLPRLAYVPGTLLVYVTGGAPERVPIELVEGFLLGQGPSYVDRRNPERHTARTLVIRLDEKAEDYAQREVKPALAWWCGSYITLRGAWCEPLSVGLVEELNRRLHEVKQAEAAS